MESWKAKKPSERPKMGHNISYMTADRNVKKNSVIAEVKYEYHS